MNKVKLQTKTVTQLGLATIIAAGLLLGSQTISKQAIADTEVAKTQSTFLGFEPPKGWMPPPIDPAGAQLQSNKLAQGVYALLSKKSPVDNSGFVVGTRGVLLIDSHINGAMAQQIQAAVRNVTDKPILYVVNTNCHGDYTFGNHAFPATTKIVAHHKTAEAMRNFKGEKSAMIRAVSGNASVIDGLQLRLPDVTFEESLTLDIGGRSVELHHFNHGNTPGDTVFYIPESKTAWTGNLLLGEKTIPWAIEGKMQVYQDTISKMTNTLDIKTIVPSHVLISDHTLLDTYAQYLKGHIQDVRDAIEEGKSLKETLAALPLAENYLAPKDSALAPVRGYFKAFIAGTSKKRTKS
jgi:cyclase